MPTPPATAPPLTPPAPQREVLKVFLASYGAPTLRTICLIWAAVIVMVGLQNYRTLGSFPGVVLVSGFALLALVLLLLQARRLQLALLVFLWGSLLLTCANAVFVAGVRTPGMLALPILCMLTSWLLGPRQAVPMLAGVCLYLVGLEVAHHAGYLPPPLQRDPLTWTVAYIAACSAGAIFGLVMTRSVQEQLARAMALGTELREANATLEHKVAGRTAELSATLERLKQTQSDLVQAEKLASLGSLVAGIAHQLNTPISNAVLTADTLSQRARALDAAMQAGTLKRSELVSGLGGLREMSALIDRSVTRAASLVSSFKQVAVDQVSEHRRVFDLRDFVEEQFAPLRSGAARKALLLVLENAVPPGLACNSYPRPLGQLLTHLVHNAMLHAFEGRTQGRVRVSARQDGSHIEWQVADDGAGMDSTAASHVFEPFYTTKLGQGGSGLGLAICYRIATTILGGEIRVITAPGTGTQFLVRMPSRSPGAV